MIRATCHCGAVSIQLSEKPAFINDCNCSLCRKQGVAWGYFPTEQTIIEGESKSFVRSDKPKPLVAVHFCAICGCVTHWKATDSENPYTGVNMKLFDRGDLDGVVLRFPDGAVWSGEGDYGYRSADETINADMVAYW